MQKYGIVTTGLAIGTCEKDPRVLVDHRLDMSQQQEKK